MQTRREFLSHVATVTLFLVPLAEAACSSSSGNGSSSGSCDGLDPTSTVALGHTHTVCVPSADLSNPPSGGATYTTSGPDPTHTITLTQAQLQSIQSGQSVTVTTSVANNHTHDFTLQT
ncbi:MAG TPA: hypothetical protein VGG39_05730 [Polyangiaceae bacterium]|jgi:hypothetical protein